MTYRIVPVEVTNYQVFAGCEPLPMLYRDRADAERIIANMNAVLEARTKKKARRVIAFHEVGCEECGTTFLARSRRARWCPGCSVNARARACRQRKKSAVDAA